MTRKSSAPQVTPQVTLQVTPQDRIEERGFRTSVLHMQICLWIQAFAALYRKRCDTSTAYTDCNERVAESINLV